MIYFCKNKFRYLKWLLKYYKIEGWNKWEEKWEAGVKILELTGSALCLEKHWQEVRESVIGDWTFKLDFPEKL